MWWDSLTTRTIGRNATSAGLQASQRARGAVGKARRPPKAEAAIAAAGKAAGEPPCRFLIVA